MHIALVVTFLIALATISHADTGYECELQQDGTCEIYMYDILDENLFTADDALEKCESFDGYYDYESDICTID